MQERKAIVVRPDAVLERIREAISAVVDLNDHVDDRSDRGQIAA